MPTAADFEALTFSQLIENIEHVYVPKREVWLQEWKDRLTQSKADGLPREHQDFIRAYITDVRKQIRDWRKTATQYRMFLARVDRRRAFMRTL